MYKKFLLVFSALVLSFALVGCKGTDVNEDAVPVITVDNAKSTVFQVGDTEPDWKTYFIVTDENDGTISVTDEMITESVDMNKAGVYVVRIDVSNSVEGYNFKEITIEVESDVEINVLYIMENGVVGDTYKLEGVEVVYKTNDEWGLYIYDGNTESDVHYFYITAYEETLSDAIADLNVGDIVDIAGELVLYKGNQQPRFENVSIVEKVGTANNPHTITPAETLTIDEYYNLPNDTTDPSSRDAWLTYGKAFEVSGVVKELAAGDYYMVDPSDDSIGLYAWAYGEGAPIADFENANNIGEAVTVETFFYNMHAVGSLNGNYARSALISVAKNDGLAAMVDEVIAGVVIEGNKMISDNVTLATSGTGYTVSWTSSDASVISTDGTVTRGQYNTDVILTYVLTAGSMSYTGNIDLTVVGTVAPPVITLVEGNDYVLDLDGTLPDFTGYFTVNDETDGAITVVESMITTNLDLTKLGAYTVTISVTNSNELTTEKTIVVNVSDGTTVIDAAWLVTDAANKLDNMYSLNGVEIVSKGVYGDEGYVFDGTNFFYIDAYGTDFEEAFVNANVGDTVNLTGTLMVKYEYKYYLGDLAFFDIEEVHDNVAFDYSTVCVDITAAELTAIVENADTYIKCFNVIGTVTEEIYEGDAYYNLHDSTDATKYFIAYSNTPALPKEEFDMNNTEEITATMFLHYSRSDKSHYGYYWILDVSNAAEASDVEYIVNNASEEDVVQLQSVTIVSKTSDETGLYVYDGTHFIYVNAYNTAFEDVAVDLQVGDTINVVGKYLHNYTYKMLISDLMILDLVESGDGTFSFDGLCLDVTVSELFAIKNTDAAFINCYDVTGVVYIEDDQYWNFEDATNTGEYFISYGYAPYEAADEFKTLDDGYETTVRMFYFRYRDDKSHGGYYWMVEVLNVENARVTLTDEPLLLPKDSTKPDFTTYFEINDDKDGEITVTTEMITESVDMATAGDYTVTLSVTDADGNVSTKEITITVVDPALIDIPWIVENGLNGQEYSFDNVTVVSKTSDGSGIYVYDGEYFFYVNGYYSDQAVKDAAISLNVGDVINISGEVYIKNNYKTQFDMTAVSLVTAGSGTFDYFGICEQVTVSELYAIKDQGMTFTKCYEVTGTVWLEDGTYSNMMDTTNNGEYFIGYSYGPTAGHAAFEALADNETFTARIFLFAYRDDKTHGGYYWILEVLNQE